MNTYTYSEARQRLASLLDKAKKEGRVLIKRKDGSMFELKSIAEKKSPLAVKGINLKISKEEIIDILKEVRER
ncbi:MAG: type II toxin-antitoxin system Phd/YefM family antitoxin [Melioribacteraceae bacterium]|nr:type II toxin-antitoxin system Phd/YefM family antitoxin [Melioribacteraceae bacterium]